MPSKVAKREKKKIFSVFRKIFSTKQMKYAIFHTIMKTWLFTYENSQKIRWLWRFFVSCL